mgnify:FL=1
MQEVTLIVNRPVDNKVMLVALPKLNESGNSIMKLFNWASTKPADVLK